MTKLQKRAIKITELTEELEDAKSIISEYVWPSDSTDASRREFRRKAAILAGCSVPVYSDRDSSEK